MIEPLLTAKNDKQEPALLPQTDNRYGLITDVAGTQTVCGEPGSVLESRRYPLGNYRQEATMTYIGKCNMLFGQVLVRLSGKARIC